MNALAGAEGCDGCIAVHTAAAIRAGATREEIAEALGTAAGVNAGAALVYSARVMDAYAAKTAKEKPSPGASRAASASA